MRNVGYYIYLEFLFPVKDYIETLKFKEFFFDWILPILIAFLYWLILFNKISLDDLSKFIGYLINVFAILVGFSITSLAILTTGENQIIRKLKNQQIHREIGGKKISLFQLIYITFSFTLIVEILTLISFLAYLLFSKVYTNSNFLQSLFLLYIVLIFHTFFLNIRNITNFYLIFWNPQH